MYDDSFKLRYRNVPIAIYENKNSADTNPHIHSEIELLFIEKGNALINVGEDELSVEKGDLIFINPLEVHSVKPCKNSEYSHKCICFDSSLVVDATLKEELLSGKTMVTKRVLSQSETIKNAFLKLYNATENEEKTLLFESTAYISLIFSYLIKNDLVEKRLKSDKGVRFCKAVTEYIADNYANDITSLDIANELFYTQSYFCRNFLKHFNVPFSKYLNMYRISKAKDMLLTTELKISDISGICGFGSPEYFAKSFKKEVGISPKSYRKGQYSTEKQ